MSLIIASIHFLHCFLTIDGAKARTLRRKESLIIDKVKRVMAQLNEKQQDYDVTMDHFDVGIFPWQPVGESNTMRNLINPTPK